MNAASRVAWAAGWPLRAVLVLLIRVYRLTLGQVIGGSCRFYPSCSAYAEQAVRELGAVRGTALTVWRILRCSPLTAGGVEYPPARRAGARVRSHLYDIDIQAQSRTPTTGKALGGRT